MIRNLFSFIPKHLLEIGRLWNNFYTFFSNQYNYFFSKILGLRSEYIAEQTTNPVELAYNVGAYITPNDTTDTIRKKIANAYKTHKYLPVFDKVYKSIIDSITGGNCELYKGSLYYGSAIVGLSTVGSPAKIGFVPFPTGVTTTKPKGEIYIDLKITPTVNQIEEIKKQLKEIIPIYFRVYIGVVTTIISNPAIVGVSIIGGTDIIGGTPAIYYNFNNLGRI